METCYHLVLGNFLCSQPSSNSHTDNLRCTNLVTLILLVLSLELPLFDLNKSHHRNYRTLLLPSLTRYKAKKKKKTKERKKQRKRERATIFRSGGGIGRMKQMWTSNLCFSGILSTYNQLIWFLLCLTAGWMRSCHLVVRTVVWRAHYISNRSTWFWTKDYTFSTLRRKKKEDKRIETNWSLFLFRSIYLSIYLSIY